MEIRLQSHDGNRFSVIEVVADGLEVRVRRGPGWEALGEPETTAHPSEEAARAHADEMVAELVKGGAVEPFRGDAEQARFYREDFFPMLEREHGVSPGGPGGLRARIEEYHGHRLPPDLDLMYRMREERRFGYCNYGEWRMWDEDAWGPDPARGNLCEQLILMDQKNYLGTALREYLVGLVPIGTAGNGDVYFSFLDLAHPENTEVFLWDHEERDLNGFADCIPSLAELNRLYVLDSGGGEAEGGDVLAAVQRGMKKLEHRVSPSWHYSDVVEHGEVEPAWKSTSGCGFLYYRAAWLDALLRQDSIRKLEAVSSWFKHFIPYHAQYPFDRVKDYATLKLPSRAIYWLFYLFFFDRERELAECIDRAKASPSPVARDAALLVEELAGGRKELGTIRDLGELRRRFLALDLDPAREEARKAETAAREAAQAAAEEADRARAEELCASESVEELVAAGWEAVGNRQIVPRLYQRVRALTPELGADLDRIAFVAENGHVRDNRVYQVERGDVIEALDEASPAVVPLMLTLGGWEMWQAAARLSPERVRPIVTERLGSKNVWERSAAVAAAGAIGALTVDELVRLVDRWSWSEEERGKGDDDEAELAGQASTLGPVASGDAGFMPAVDEAQDEDEDEDEDDEDEDDEDEDGDDDEGEVEASDEDRDDEEESDEDDEDDDEEAEAADDTGDEEDDDLVDKPAYIRAIENKEALIAAVRALGTLGDPAAIPTLNRIIATGPKPARTPAVIALGQLGSAARPHLEALLGGAFERPALYGLARLRDPAAFPAVDARLAALAGHPMRLIHERLMHAAVAEAAGRPVDLDAVRLALDTVMDSKYEAVELHEVALDLLSRTAAPVEVAVLARPFVDADQPAVRRAALRALERAGQPVTPRRLDRPTVDALFERGGAAALKDALTDPAAVHRYNVLRKAVDTGCAGELAAAAAPIVEELARFEHYAHTYVRAELDRMEYAVEALAHFPSEAPGVDETLDRLRRHPSVLVREVDTFKYDRDDIGERLARFGAPTERPARRSLAHPAPRAVALEPVSFPAYQLGADVHGICPAGDRIVAVGGGGSSIFDRTGAPLPAGAALASGWAFDVDLDPAGHLLAIGYSHSHFHLCDAATGARVRELKGHGGGVRKVVFSPSGRLIASASDDRTLRVWDPATGAERFAHQEPYDVNTVAWIDEDTLAFGTDQHVGVIAIAGGEPRRFASGAVAEVQIQDGLIVAGTRQHGIAFLDPASLEIRRTLSPRGVARLRRSPDGRHLWVACWEGEHVGLSRWDLATGEGAQLDDEVMFALAVDAAGRCYAGGKSQRVSVFEPDGTRSTAAGLEHAAGIVSIRPAPGGAWVLDGSGQFLRWALGEGRATARLAPPRPLSGADDGLVAPDAAIAWVAGDTRIAAVEDGRALWSRQTQRIERVALTSGEIVIGSGRNLCWLDPASGETRHEADAGTASTWIHTILPIDDELLFVAGYDDPRFQVWSSRERRRVRELEADRLHDDGRFARAYGMTLTPKSRRLLVSYWNDTLDLIDLERMEVLRTLRTWHAYEYLAVDEEETLAAAGTESSVTLLDLATGLALAELEMPGKMTAMAFTGPDRLLCGFADGSLRALRL